MSQNNKLSSNRNLMITGVVVLVLILASVVLFSIFNKNNSDEFNIDLDGGNLQGSTSQQKPADFPSSITTQNGTIVQSTRLDNADLNTVSWTVQVETNTPNLESAIENVKNDFPANIWAHGLEASDNRGALLSFSNSEYRVGVTIDDDKSAGVIRITYTVDEAFGE